MDPYTQYVMASERTTFHLSDSDESHAARFQVRLSESNGVHGYSSISCRRILKGISSTACQTTRRHQSPKDKMCMPKYWHEHDATFSTQVRYSTFLVSTLYISIFSFIHSFIGIYLFYHASTMNLKSSSYSSLCVYLNNKYLSPHIVNRKRYKICKGPPQRTSISWLF